MFLLRLLDLWVNVVLFFSFWSGRRFFLLLALWYLCYVMLDRYSESKHCFLAPAFKEKMFSHSPLSVMAAIRLFLIFLQLYVFIDSCNWVEEVAFDSWFAENFWWEMEFAKCLFLRVLKWSYNLLLWVYWYSKLHWLIFECKTNLAFFDKPRLVTLCYRLYKLSRSICSNII